VLQVRLLGAIEVEAGDEKVATDGRRTWSLLAWFALHPGLHPRGDLAARFWPDVLDSSARGSLRSAMWALRQELGPAADVLVATRDRVGLDPAGLWTDHAEFGRLVEADRLEDAVALARGPLLAGIEDDWAYEARDDHTRALSAVLARLAETAGDPAAAVAWARRRAALDPLDEAAARDLIDRLAVTGDRSGALAAYGRLCDRLRDELGVAPAPATRGLAERVRAEAPGDVGAPAPPRVPSDAVALVGRRAELGVLRAAWAGAQVGRGALVLLGGEGGIGKSRLAAELLDDAAATGALTATCGALDLAGGAPFAPWAELLRDLAPNLPAPPAAATWPEELARLVPSLPERLGRAAQPARPAGPPELERARLFEAAVELVEHAARDAPVALLFEDVHAADAASLELAAYVARRIGPLRLLLVLTRRPFPRGERVDALVIAVRARQVRVAEIDLVPLGHREMGELVRAVATLDDRGVDRVVAVADGNPLLAIEAARAVRDGAEGPPPGLRAAVRAATAALPPDARRLAEVAAVAGGDLNAAELDMLTTGGALAQALDSGLFTGRDGRFGYHHALLREAAYDDLPGPRRAELHAEYAVACNGAAAERAHHWRRAGRHDLAVAELARAADNAWAVSALDAAAAFLREAVELAPDDAQLWLRLAETEAWRGLRVAANVAFDRALERIDRRDTRRLAEAWIGRAKWSRGSLCDPLGVRDAARRGIELLGELGEHDSAVAMEAAASLSWSEAVGGDVAEGRRVLDAIVVDEPPALLAHDLAFARGHLLVGGGDLAAGQEAFAESAVLASRAGRPELAWAAWINGACAACALGEFAAALAFVDRCLAEVGGLGPLQLSALSSRAFILGRTGRHAEARAAAAQERDLAVLLADDRKVALAEHDSGLVALAARHWDEAVRHLTAALDGNAEVSRPQVLLARAEALARSGRPDDAEADLRATTLEPLRPGDFPEALVPRLTRVQGLIAAARGDAPLARRRLGEAAAGWRRLAATGDTMAASWHAALVDFGRPPVAGLVEPDRELAAVEADLAALPEAEEAVHAERR
jgi:DNA-binding SARP family transcriptional activator/tetratricopeptide (TPR) repeat protein